MDTSILDLAAKLLKISTEEAEAHCKKIEEADAFYFWKPVRGGTSVIIGSDGQWLGAVSSVSFKRHLADYLAGKRSKPKNL